MGNVKRDLRLPVFLFPSVSSAQSAVTRLIEKALYNEARCGELVNDCYDSSKDFQIARGYPDGQQIGLGNNATRGRNAR